MSTPRTAIDSLELYQFIGTAANWYLEFHNNREALDLISRHLTINPDPERFDEALVSFDASLQLKVFLQKLFSLYVNPPEQALPFNIIKHLFTAEEGALFKLNSYKEQHPTALNILMPLCESYHDSFKRQLNILRQHRIEEQQAESERLWKNLSLFISIPACVNHTALKKFQFAANAHSLFHASNINQSVEEYERINQRLQRLQALKINPLTKDGFNLLKHTEKKSLVSLFQHFADHILSWLRIEELQALANVDKIQSLFARKDSATGLNSALTNAFSLLKGTLTQYHLLQRIQKTELFELALYELAIKQPEAAETIIAQMQQLSTHLDNYVVSTPPPKKRPELVEPESKATAPAAPRRSLVITKKLLEKLPLPINLPSDSSDEEETPPSFSPPDSLPLDLSEPEPFDLSLSLSSQFDQLSAEDKKELPSVGLSMLSHKCEEDAFLRFIKTALHNIEWKIRWCGGEKIETPTRLFPAAPKYVAQMITTIKQGEDQALSTGHILERLKFRLEIAAKKGKSFCYRLFQLRDKTTSQFYRHLLLAINNAEYRPPFMEQYAKLIQPIPQSNSASSPLLR